MKRRLKDWSKKAILRVHKSLLPLKLTVLPNHYYSPVPDINQLAQNRSLWAKPSPLTGVHFDHEEQSQNLVRICKPFQSEYAGNKAYREGVTGGWGPGFGYIEAQALHSFVRYFKPHLIIEVGAGVTTHCMLSALALNESHDSRGGTLYSIEPYPSTQLRCAPVKLFACPVQEMEIEVFQQLQSGDLLFIDSSHTVKTGSDVNFLLLEILPRLCPGVLVHLHDIYLPYQYRPDILNTFFDWQETSLLHAYLISNSTIEVLFCMSFLHHMRPAVLQEVFPEYRPLPLSDGLLTGSQASRSHQQQKQFHFPASIFLRIR